MSLTDGSTGAVAWTLTCDPPEVLPPDPPANWPEDVATIAANVHMPRSWVSSHVSPTWGSGPLLRWTSIGTAVWVFVRSTVMAVVPSAEMDWTVTSLAVKPTELVVGFSVARGAAIYLPPVPRPGMGRFEPAVSPPATGKPMSWPPESLPEPGSRAGAAMLTVVLKKPPSPIWPE